jgi:hypothetical protein
MKKKKAHGILPFSFFILPSLAVARRLRGAWS